MLESWMASVPESRLPPQPKLHGPSRGALSQERGTREIERLPRQECALVWATPRQAPFELPPRGTDLQISQERLPRYESCLNTEHGSTFSRTR
jgi:hypothetical protein